MKKDTRWISFTGVGALALLFVAGCTGADQTGDGQTADSPEAAKAQNAVDKMQDSAKMAGKTVVNAASKAGEATANAASKMAPAVENAAGKAAASAKNLDDAAIITPKVKSMILANAAMKGSTIDVSTTDKNLTLDGKVKTAAQKSLAGNIAKANAPGYVIKNNLKVG